MIRVKVLGNICKGMKYYQLLREEATKGLTGYNLKERLDYRI